MEIDFIENSKTRTLSELLIEKRTGQIETTDNSVLDMRISEFVINEDNAVTFKLIFKLDYYPKVFIDLYTLFLTMDIEFIDSNRIFEKSPTSELCVAYMAGHYKESGERLFQELDIQFRRISGRGIDGDLNISDEEAQAQLKIILNNYFGN